jgi:hypothetical protein
VVRWKTGRKAFVSRQIQALLEIFDADPVGAMQALQG